MQRQASQGYVAPWVNGSSHEIVENGRAFLQSRGKPGNQRFQSRGRKQFQARRVEKHREDVGAVNNEQYDKAIRAKLLAGLKDEASGVATKEAALLETAAPLQVTTRQIGFGLTKMLNTANVDQKLSEMANNGRGTVNQYYRIGLSLVETKLHKTSIRVTEPIDEVEELPNFKHDAEFQNVSTTAVLMPEPISSFINSIGIYKDSTEAYFCTMPKDHTSRGNFIPLPENLRISNLRRSVLALADQTTPEAVRVNFENKNPIPGAIWMNHVLQNPDEIIEDNYGAEELEDDLNLVAPHFERLGVKYPKYVGKIDWEKFESGKEIFVSNELADMHVRPRRVNESEANYTTRSKVVGDQEIFKMKFPLKEAELCRGINLLMGEVPNAPSRLTFYVPRIPRYLRYKSTLNYKSVVNMRYVT